MDVAEDIVDVDADGAPMAVLRKRPAA